MASRPQSQPVPDDNKPKLELLDWHWNTGYGYAKAERRVQNISADRLDNVMAVVTWETKDGEFVTTREALVDYNPILPGQTSPWSAMAKHNPAMHSAQEG